MPEIYGWLLAINLAEKENLLSYPDILNTKPIPVNTIVRYSFYYGQTAVKTEDDKLSCLLHTRTYLFFAL